MNRSPLHEVNQSLGARFVDFGGWEMPVQYDSVLAEHRAVRNRSGFFDVTHLGRFELEGHGAREAIRRLLCNDIDRIEPGRCQYTMILNEDGGIIDDLIVWWWDDERFWVLPNAGNHRRVMDVFAEQPECVVTDLQETTVMIALQGPEAPAVFEEVLGIAPRRFGVTHTNWRNRDVSIAGTGYTGEDGGEICTDADTGRELLEVLVESGVTPSGLGARDTLRLEAGFPLWGEDIDEATTPYEAGLRFAVSLDHDFVGRPRIEQQAEDGVERLLCGLVVEDRGIPRHGYPVRTPEGAEGVVTSGNMSPMLGTGVALAYFEPPPNDVGGPAEVQIRE
ncbi:MAG: glycine cleavage system aminomethyltransferase GcvT, partial [Acidimicrobiia bacterium]